MSNSKQPNTGSEIRCWEFRKKLFGCRQLVRMVRSDARTENPAFKTWFWELLPIFNVGICLIYISQFICLVDFAHMLGRVLLGRTVVYGKHQRELCVNCESCCTMYFVVEMKLNLKLMYKNAFAIYTSFVHHHHQRSYCFKNPGRYLLFVCVKFKAGRLLPSLYTIHSIPHTMLAA